MNDPVADRIENLVRQQRRSGENAPKWQPLEPGQCCLCGHRTSTPPPTEPRYTMLIPILAALPAIITALAALIHSIRSNNALNQRLAALERAASR